MVVTLSSLLPPNSSFADLLENAPVGTLTNQLLGSHSKWLDADGSAFNTTTYSELNTYLVGLGLPAGTLPQETSTARIADIVPVKIKALP